MREVAEMIVELSGSGSEISHRPLPEDDPKQRCPDITRAREVLGWEPQTGAREGSRRPWNGSRLRRRLDPRRRPRPAKAPEVRVLLDRGSRVYRVVRGGGPPPERTRSRRLGRSLDGRSRNVPQRSTFYEADIRSGCAEIFQRLRSPRRSATRPPRWT